MDQLKPACVRLNEAALKFRASHSDSNDVVASLGNLHNALKSFTEDNARLDRKLADYVFFPLSHVFRELQNLPFKAIELALSCVQSLLLSGWKIINDQDLAVQLFLLLTHIAGFDSLHGNHATAPDELLSISFSCQGLLFKAIKNSKASKDYLLGTANVPSVGHAISTMLDAAKDRNSVQVQLSALHALSAFQTSVLNPEIIASFLPGIVSSLTQISTPKTQTRRSYRVLIGALDLLRSIILMVLSDSMESPISKSSTNMRELGSSSEIQNERTQDWVQATAGQIRLALSNIAKLCRHDRHEVRDALRLLCFDILEKCFKNLHSSASLVTETLLILSVNESDEKSRINLQYLMTFNPGIGEFIRATLFDSLVALPRVMMSNDSNKKSITTTKIIQSFKLLLNTDLDMTVVNSVLKNSLRDSTMNAISTSDRLQLDTIKISGNETPVFPSLIEDESRTDVDVFDSILVGYKNGEESLKYLQSFVKQISITKSSTSIARDYLDQARITDGDARLVNFWLCVNIMKIKMHDDLNIEEFTNLSDWNDEESTLCDEIFLLALSLLGESDTERELDWRIQTLAIHAIAFQAKRLGKDFRMELADALYPVVHLMGSDIAPLHSTAFNCLNLIAHSSGYVDAKELLISNVDYLVNAIGIKLNAFDLSPQAPQVLIMMIRLCGSTLLPYLDDIVEDIFGSLECFHGYPVLVDLLFSVLSTIVTEATNQNDPSNSVKMIKDEKPHSHPTTVQGVSELLKQNQIKTSSRRFIELNHTSEEDDLPLSTPQIPWNELPDRNGTKSGDENANNVQESNRDELDQTVKTPTKIHSLVLRIASLTQHHLPSASSSLRSSLISLLKNALPYLATDEDTFLPLLNTLWPTLVPRLSDKEPYVVAGILNVMGSFCSGAGDFMRSRIQNIWPQIRILRSKISHEKQSHHPTHDGILNFEKSPVLLRQLSSSDAQFNDARSQHNIQRSLVTRQSNNKDSSRQIGTNTYVPTSSRLIESALRDFLVSLLTHVHIEESMFSEIVSDVFNGSLDGETEPEIQHALENVNMDAVWLAAARYNNSTSAHLESHRMVVTTKPQNVGSTPYFVDVLL